jgi:hypothetical protein
LSVADLRVGDKVKLEAKGDVAEEIEVKERAPGK